MTSIFEEHERWRSKNAQEEKGGGGGEEERMDG